jgi:hypothetical protein
MSYESLLAEGRLRRRKTSREDVRHLLRLAERDLADAAVAGLSADRRFLIAYEAALALATVPLFSAGYETHGSGHHWVTFQMLPRFMGEEYAELATYFESCRTKRNVGAYDRGGEISDSEANELLKEVADFKSRVEAWIRINHPGLR